MADFKSRMSLDLSNLLTNERKNQLVLSKNRLTSFVSS